MHIGMIAYTNYEYDPRVRREAEALAARGDTVDFLCLKEEDDPPSKILAGVRLLHLKIRRYRGDNGLRYLLSYLRFFVHATLRIGLEHARNRYAIVHVHTMPDFLVFSAVIPKILGAKVILDVHDLTPELYGTKFGTGRKVRLVKFLTFVERRSVAFAHRAIAVHKPHLDALVRHGNPAGKFFVLLNTPDQKIFNRTAPVVRRSDGLFKLIYHGAIARRHGLEIALRAVSIVRKEIPSLSFDIIGSGDDLSRLVKLADELGLHGFVRFPGPVPMKALSEVIRSADLGVIPVLNDNFTRYMLPTKLLEYVFLGIPSITSRTTTIESYFDETMVRFVEAGNVESLVEALCDLFRHPEKLRAMVENANKFNEQYCWEKQKVGFYRFVDHVVGNHQAGTAYDKRKDDRLLEGERDE